jgi:hypothetical protein
LLKIIKGNRRIYIHTCINRFKNAMIVNYILLSFFYERVYCSLQGSFCLFLYHFHATSNHTLSLSLDIGNLWSTDCLPLTSTCVHPRVFVGSMFLFVVVFCVVLCFALWKCLSISLRMW